MMAERFVPREFGGSDFYCDEVSNDRTNGEFHAVRFCAKCGQSTSTANAARVAEQERVAAEVTEAHACESDGEIVFMERGGSSSAKKMLTDLTQKQEGMTRPEKTIPLVMMYHPGETKVTALLQAQLEHHAVDEDDRAAKLLLEVEGTTKVVAYISRPNSRPRMSWSTIQKPRPRP